MTPEEILAVDVKRNYPEGTDVRELITDINDEIRQGGELLQHKNVLIVYRTVSPKVVEHHSFNADTAANLVEANEKLWTMLKRAGAEKAYTTYTNPKISDLIEREVKNFNINITEADGVYTAMVEL